MIILVFLKHLTNLNKFNCMINLVESGRSPYTPTKVVWGNKMSILVELFKEAKTSLKKKGMIHVFKMGLITIWEYIQLRYYKKFRTDDTFHFNGKNYPYFFHGRVAGAGPSWKNERCVNIPIVLDIIKDYRNKDKKVLELGNVLSYAINIDHDVIDKYEIMEGIINEDIVDYDPPFKYDLIVSVLCLQSVGWDEIPKDPPKILRALDNMNNMLAPGGKMVISIGWGWNQYLESLILEGKFKFDRQWYLKKEKGYTWKEVPSIDYIKDLKYDEKAYTALGIIVGIIEKRI